MLKGFFFPTGKEALNRRDIIEVVHMKNGRRHKAFLETNDIWEVHLDQETMADLIDRDYEALRDRKLMKEY
jgi:hypothetical protein